MSRKTHLWGSVGLFILGILMMIGGPAAGQTSLGMFGLLLLPASVLSMLVALFRKSPQVDSRGADKIGMIRQYMDEQAAAGTPVGLAQAKAHVEGRLSGVTPVTMPAPTASPTVDPPAPVTLNSTAPSANGLASSMVGLILLLVVAWGGYQLFFSDPVNSSDESVQPTLVLQGTQMETGEFGERYITGAVQNTTDEPYDYVQVEINLYDDTGAQVGSTLANVNNLAAGAVWKFKATVLEDEATAYEVKEITGF